MSQVLRFGVPQKEGLVCDAPACKELATHEIKFTRGQLVEKTLRCAEHYVTVTKDPLVSVIRFTKLIEPGERNPELAGGQETKLTKPSVGVGGGGAIPRVEE